MDSKTNAGIVPYREMTADERARELDALRQEYQSIKGRKLSLDMSRGKPSPEQCDLSTPMLNVLKCPEDCFDKNGVDCRNYGAQWGIQEARALLGYIMDAPAENVIVYGNSSLNMMHDLVSRAWAFGCLGSTPWKDVEGASFICPVPGYDRHFSVLEKYGIGMITVSLGDSGPDMDAVEELAASSDTVKGIFCVPIYSNPTGCTYSDEVVRRLANMECAADDFRIFWDMAYNVHHLYESPKQDRLLDIAAECERAGYPDRYYKFGSTSKITFPGAGITGLAASDANLAEIKKSTSIQTIGPDKISQLRHVRFLPDAEALKQHMKKNAALMLPKFELVYERLHADMDGLDIARWTQPLGGYFISFDGLPNTARRTVGHCREAGVVLTPAGATYPYGKDPDDSNIRIAPTVPPLDELDEALDVFVCCAKIAALESLQR